MTLTDLRSVPGLTLLPTYPLPRLNQSDIIAAQSIMQRLSQSGFKPGSAKSKRSNNFTRAMSKQCIQALARLRGDRTRLISEETYNATTGRSADIMGIIDLEMGYYPANGTPYVIGIQACRADSKTNDWQAHIKKISDYDHIQKAIDYLSLPGHEIQLWGWGEFPCYRKDGSKGKTKFWYPRIQVITMGFLLGEDPPHYVKLEIN